MLTPELISFLSSSEGSKLLQEALTLPPDELSRITHLRKSHPSDQVAAAIETLDLRSRARAKFYRADEMFFTREGLEQSSSEEVARWRAARFPDGADILDLCCGIGGDAVALSKRGTVHGVDICPVAAACAAANLKVHGFCANVACLDVTKLEVKGDAALFDPSRRRNGKRVRAGDNYSPPLSFIEQILRHIPNLAVKVSPALDDHALESLGGRVEFVSHRGECKEAVIWFGDLGPWEARSASIVDAGVSMDYRGDIPVVSTSKPLTWIFEPDPAVIRAHLISEIAAELNANQLDPMIAYLTSEQTATTPFGTWYRIVEWFPFNLKKIQLRLRKLDARLMAVKKRGVPFEPDDLMKRLKPCGDRPLILIIGRTNGDPAAFLCEREVK